MSKALHDRGARGVLAGIIAISRETGSYLIAEGVENEQLLEFARNAHTLTGGSIRGIQGVQGYLFGRPAVGTPDIESLAWRGDVLLATPASLVA